MRKKKTPEELAAEAEQEDLDDFTSKCGRKWFHSDRTYTFSFSLFSFLFTEN